LYNGNIVFISKPTVEAKGIEILAKPEAWTPVLGLEGATTLSRIKTTQKNGYEVVASYPEGILTHLEFRIVGETLTVTGINSFKTKKNTYVLNETPDYIVATVGGGSTVEFLPQRVAVDMPSGEQQQAAIAGWAIAV